MTFGGETTTSLTDAAEKVEAMEKNLAAAKLEHQRAGQLRDAAYAARAAREVIMTAALAAPSPAASVSAHGQSVDTPAASNSAPTKARAAADGAAPHNSGVPRKRARSDASASEDADAVTPPTVQGAG